MWPGLCAPLSAGAWLEAWLPWRALPGGWPVCLHSQRGPVGPKIMVNRDWGGGEWPASAGMDPCGCPAWLASQAVGTLYRLLGLVELGKLHLPAS